MLYRIHESNVIGKLTSENVLLRRLKSLVFRNTFVIYKPSYISKIEFYNFFRLVLNKNKIKIFESYFLYCNSNMLRRLVIAFSGRVTKFRLYLIYRTVTKSTFGK